MKKSFYTLIFLVINNCILAQTSSTLAPLLNFNFAGKQNTWTNFTPVVSYGWSKNFISKSVFKEPFNFEFNINPYIGTTINIKDSTGYLPALMLPGNAGLEIAPFFIFGDTSNFSVTLCPRIGLKVISGFTDSSISLVQHYFNLSAGFKYSDLFILQTAFTWGAHNSTDYSDLRFKSLFLNKPSNVQYLSINLQTKVTNISGATPLYLNITWRKLFTQNFNYLPNRRIFTIGLISSLNLRSATQPQIVNRLSLY